MTDPSSSSISSRKLRIAVSGGGLAGATLANALIIYPHIDVQVYESAPEFSERGASVGIAINAQNALAQIIPDASALLERAGAVPNNSARFMIVRSIPFCFIYQDGSGPQADTFVLDVAVENPVKAVHRAALLRELLRPLPPSSLHLNKKLLTVTKAAAETDQEYALELRFEDGTTTYADALIGADGIFSIVRQHVLGANDPAIQPLAAGCEARQYDWIGANGFILHDILDNGQTAQCIACCVDRNPSPDRKRYLTREMLEDSFREWPKDGLPWRLIPNFSTTLSPYTRTPPPANNKSSSIISSLQLLLSQENHSGYAQWEQPDASTYTKGPVCIIGDAAHAITPWQGSGAALVIEDAMVLGKLLGAVRHPHQIESALQAYDAVRRPRTQEVGKSSRETGKIMTGQTVSVEDSEGVRAALEERWRFIFEFDLGEHKADALRELSRRLRRS